MDEDALPLADPSREAHAIELFPLDMSPDEYAARHGHHWMTFSFDDYSYRNDDLSRWIQRLGNILFRRNGAPSLAELRAMHLSANENERIESELAYQSNHGSF